jgi:hypothetical protein
MHESLFDYERDSGNDSVQVSNVHAQTSVRANENIVYSSTHSHARHVITSCVCTRVFKAFTFDRADHYLSMSFFL